MNTTPGFDRSLFLHINAFARHTGWLHEPMRLFAADGVVLFGILLLVAWWRARSLGALSVTRALLSPVAVLVAVALNQPLVHHFAEQRPFVAYPNALLLVSHSADPGFPSDHATMVGAVAVGVIASTWRPGLRWLGSLTAVLALLMCFARVYVGVHYPLDVIAGLVVGGLVAAVVVLLGGRLAVPVVRRLEQTRLRPLVTTAG